MDALIMLVWRYRVAQTIEIRDRYAKEIVLAIARDLRRFIAVGCQYNEEDTKEVVQETLISIFDSLESFCGTTDAEFWKFCYTIARRRIADHWRAVKRVPTPIGPDEIQRYVDASNKVDPILTDERQELYLTLERLRKINVGCYNILFQRYVLGLSVAQIAKNLGITEDTSRKRILRCRKKLEGVLKKGMEV